MFVVFLIVGQGQREKSSVVRMGHAVAPRRKKQPSTTKRTGEKKTNEHETQDEK